MSQQWTSWRTQRKTERLRTTAYWRRCPEAQRTGWAWSPYRRSTTKDTKSEQVVSTTKQRLGRTKAHRQTVTSKDLISANWKRSIERQKQPKEGLILEIQEPIVNGPINGQTQEHWASLDENWSNEGLRIHQSSTSNKTNSTKSSEIGSLGINKFETKSSKIRESKNTKSPHKPMVSTGTKRNQKNYEKQIFPQTLI